MFCEFELQGEGELTGPEVVHELTAHTAAAYLKVFILSVLLWRVSCRNFCQTKLEENTNSGQNLHALHRH